MVPTATLARTCGGLRVSRPWDTWGGARGSSRTLSGRLTSRSTLARTCGGYDQRRHQAPGREDDARRRREELVSTVHDGADGREPRHGRRGDVLMISVDLVAIERLEATVPLVLEICFDGRCEAVWAEPWAPSGPAGALVAAQLASQQPPPPGGHEGARRALFDLAVLGQKFRGFIKPCRL